MALGLEVKVNAGEIPRVAGRVFVACQAFVFSCSLVTSQSCGLIRLHYSSRVGFSDSAVSPAAALWLCRTTERSLPDLFLIVARQMQPTCRYLTLKVVPDDICVTKIASLWESQGRSKVIIGLLIDHLLNLHIYTCLLLLPPLKSPHYSHIFQS